MKQIQDLSTLHECNFQQEEAPYTSLAISTFIVFMPGIDRLKQRLSSATFLVGVINNIGIAMEQKSLILALVPSFLSDLATPFERVPSASKTRTLDLSYRT